MRGMLVEMAASILISYSDWQQIMSDLEWSDPYPDQLWAAIGGGSQQTVDANKVAQLVAGLGWSAAHAEAIWQAVQNSSIPASQAASAAMPAAASQAAPAAMPWEQSVVSAPQQSELRSPTKRLSAELPARRLLAAFVDALAWLLVAFAVVKLAGLDISQLSGRSSDSAQLAQLALSALTISSIMLLLFYWTMRRPSHVGQTLGKQLANLKVCNQDGGELSTKALLMREGLLILVLPWVACWLLNSLIWPLGFVVVAAWLAASLLGKAPQDLVAGSRSVKS